jgi:zinc protease
VRAFFATHYLPNNAVLTLVGDLEPDAALEMMEAHFGPIPAGPVPPRPNGFAAAAVARAGRRDEVREAVPLPRLYLGCVTPPLGDDGFDAADFVADLLATGRSSRLQTRLVRELRLAQAVDAYTFPLVGGAGLLLMEATARPDVSAATLEAALGEEMDQLAARPVAEEELARVRLLRATRRGTTMQRAEERADRIGMYACLLNDPDRFRGEAERDAAIGAEAVRAYADRWLDEAHRAHVWFLPKDA